MIANTFRGAAIKEVHHIATQNKTDKPSRLLAANWGYVFLLWALRGSCPFLYVHNRVTAAIGSVFVPPQLLERTCIYTQRGDGDMFAPVGSGGSD